MKAVMVMFDSLNRHMLPPYGCEWVHAPNFRRLAKRAITFDTSYVCSMPCMPARRDLHTGRPNFLHRGWGPLEAWDESMPRQLGRAGVTSHLMTDHQHYFETGGLTYHTCYNTWQFFRGQEGDPWMGQADPEPAAPGWVGRNAINDEWHGQDRVNRKFMRQEQDQPQAKTFAAGLDFIHRNHDEDNWFLQIETFDPHEPFFTQRKYKDLYAEHHDTYDGPRWDWPPYSEVTEPRDQVEHMRYEYAALLSMCDAKLGDVLDAFDEHGLWDDTMLIVWTDHGFLLGEQNCWAKIWMPYYEEVAHTPFFVWDPRCPVAAGQRRQSLVQPSIDLGPTLLEFFGQPVSSEMTGRPLAGVIRDDTPVRNAAIFGHFGGMLNVTDGRYLYEHSPARDDNQPLFHYTLLPTAMRTMFAPGQFSGTELVDGFSFMAGCRVMKIPVGEGRQNARRWGDRLYDLHADPGQSTTIVDPDTRDRLLDQAVELMKAIDAPTEQYQRLGLQDRVATTAV